MWIKGITMVWLLVMSVTDIIRRRIPIWMLGIQAALTAGVLFSTAQTGELHVMEVCRAAIPGLLLTAIALATKKAGWADGVILVLLGIQTGYKCCLTAALTGLFLMALLSVVLLLLRRVKKDTGLPFVPFLLAGWLFGQAGAGI